MRTRIVELQKKANNSSLTTIESYLLFIVGTCITLAALIYMIVNLDKADSIIKMWVLLMATGLLLMFFGLIFSRYRKCK
jgi:uncharacterized membrane protein